MTALCCVFLIPLPALPAPLEPHFEERQGLTRLVTRSPQPLRGQARSQAEPVPESVRRWRVPARNVREKCSDSKSVQ